jgi:glutamate N-acetyltransferase / amino-acid N-acetyltransferase
MKVTEEEIKIIEGNITSPKGFMATGHHIGVKRMRKDLAMICSDIPAKASAVFTQNVIKAPPVLRCEKIIKNVGLIRGLVVNSGNANACTGETGYEHAEIMAQTLAECLNANGDEFLSTSTGVIGVFLPIEKIVDGIKNNYKNLSNTLESGKLAAEAIMTTDTFSKEVAVQITIEDKTVKIGGIAKGSGMIHPNMATMLGFITTDANISQEMLDKAFKATIEESYNMISVDGDTSTNDMVVILANGLAGNDEINSEDENYKKFKNALQYVNTSHAKQIIHDGEGAKKFIEVNMTGTKTKKDAKQLCKSVLTSNLVKTAFFGQDANWGRVLAAMGYSGVHFDQNTVIIEFESNYGSITLFQNGLPVNFSEEKALNILKEKEIKVNVTLGEGEHKATGWGCDLSYDYVKINAEYRT